MVATLIKSTETKDFALH